MVYFPGFLERLFDDIQQLCRLIEKNIQKQTEQRNYFK